MNRPQRGVALLVVLWACTLLAIVVGGFASIARVEALQTRFTLAQQRARYAAEAGIMQAIAATDARRRQAVLAPTEATPPARLPGDGRALALDFEDMHVAVGIVDETGKVDINRADSRTLEALFLAAGCGAPRAAALKDQVERWRGPVPGPVGDDGAPRAIARPAATAGRYVSFAAIEELQALPGMDAELFVRIAPAVTVWSGQTAPEPRFAPLLALATLRGVDLAQARAIVMARDSAPPGTVLHDLPGGISLGDPLPGNAFTFSAAADDGHGGRATVEATVVFALAASERVPGQPLYTIVRWRDGPAS
ncbi:general secretion pathway protein GspK [Luteibacter yeojuensis]|nr:type II secretion system protein GspK [Luteibacter yeojuensis]